MAPVINSHMVPVDVPELDVHERVKLDGDGRGDADVGAGLADGGLAGGDDESEPSPTEPRLRVVMRKAKWVEKLARRRTGVE